MILIEEGNVFFRSEAALRIAKKLRPPWPILYIFKLIPRRVRDVIYNWIAKNRYHWFGKREQCMVPTAEWKERFLE
jgi:predicted DCC family thiol-disulfide oxidoreductase YuxK